MNATTSILWQIRLDGPVTLAAFMATATGDPAYGYYATQPSVDGGDFTTSPEISQIFGELIGLWCGDFWQRNGRPGLCRLIELGPGRGTLMADLLRASRWVSGFGNVLQIHMVETSGRLRSLQKQALVGTNAHWHEQLEDVPEDGPALIIANEFLDALPIRQFSRQPDGWHERRVATDPATGAFVFVQDPQPSAAAALLPQSVKHSGQPGDVAEVSPAAARTIQLLATRVAREGGAALMIDYGRDRAGVGASLRAIRERTPVDPLSLPGTADISAHVCFETAARTAAACNAMVYGPISQGVFLERLGIHTRAARLCQTQGADATAITAAVTRLTAPEAMGTLFRVLAITAPGAEPPAGFNAADLWHDDKRQEPMTQPAERGGNDK